jgi:hypothetical protein
VWAHHPHSVVAKMLGVEKLRGGLLDGPVYRSIYQNLKGITLTEGDQYAPFNTGFIVYHDDFGDYSTNEPIMDGTASLVYLISGYADEGMTVEAVAAEARQSKASAAATRKRRRGN